MSKFSERVRSLRQEKNLSLRQLAALTGISHSAISSYEKGRREPSFESLEALADVFNCDIDYVLGRTDTKNAVAESLGFSSLYDINLQLFAEPLPKNVHPLTEEEVTVVEAYRAQPELQTAVKRVLGLDDSVMYIAAETKKKHYYTKNKIEKIDSELSDKLYNAPKDESDIM